MNAGRTFISETIRSPEGIRTLVADLRSQSPRPLDDGAVPFLNLCITRTKHIQL